MLSGVYLYAFGSIVKPAKGAPLSSSCNALMVSLSPQGLDHLGEFACPKWRCLSIMALPAFAGEGVSVRRPGPHRDV